MKPIMTQAIRLFAVKPGLENLLAKSNDGLPSENGQQKKKTVPQ
jgi:hypothetical protein